MAAPRVFAIYWGRDYGSPATGRNATATNLDSFFATVLSGRWVDNLAENGVGSATFLGSTWIDHDTATIRSYTPSEIETLLSGWLDAGVSPATPGPEEHDLLFVIFVPSEVTTIDADGSKTFCAYHNYGFYKKSTLFAKHNLFYAVIDAPGLTAVTAHELAEAFTDRSSNGWYSDDNATPPASLTDPRSGICATPAAPAR